MNIIKPKFEIIEQDFNNDILVNMYKHIEKCGRTCYKSNDKITEDSYKKFVDNLIKSKHGAILEHGTVYLKFTMDYEKMKIVNKYIRNPYSCHTTDNKFYYVTTNYRVLVENGWLDDLKYICEPTEYHEKRITAKFICDIGVSREYNRHRKDSMAEESTRYCNYYKDKFGGELNIVKPVWISEDDINQWSNIGYNVVDYCNDIVYNKDDKFSDIDYWLFANLACEYSYLNLIKLGWKPQQARTILPLDTCTTLIHTAYIKDWKHFFDLRALGTTGAPHPSAKELAEPLMNEFKNREYI